MCPMFQVNFDDLTTLLVSINCNIPISVQFILEHLLHVYHF